MTALSGKLTEAINQEIGRGVTLHGPLPADETRAATILMEEVGEAARPLLDIGRILKRGGSYAEIHKARLEAIRELLQVAAVAVQMIRNLDAEGTYE